MRQIMEILDYIEKDPLSITLKSTADHFGFHPNYLSFYIKKSTGQSFKELIIMQKMCQACFYLTNTEMPVYEIAEKIGYDNLGFFYKKFEKLYHMTPQTYRQLKI
jgi:AraC-type DNA-binding domain-containing proteins